jgi:hypothetical protein
MLMDVADDLAHMLAIRCGSPAQLLGHLGYLQFVVGELCGLGYPTQPTTKQGGTTQLSRHHPW